MKSYNALTVKNDIKFKTCTEIENRTVFFAIHYSRDGTYLDYQFMILAAELFDLDVAIDHSYQSSKWTDLENFPRRFWTYNFTSSKRIWKEKIRFQKLLYSI